MRIAFIFAHRDSDIWSTPLSIVNEFKARGWKTKIYSLFNERDEYVTTNYEKIATDGFDPQIVMFMDWGRHDSPLLGNHLYPNAYWIMESGDDPQNFNNNSKKAHKFDLVLTSAHDSYLKYKVMGVDVLWWTHFADTNICKIYPNESELIVRSTRGSGGSSLMDYLSQVMPNKFQNRNGLYGKQYGEFLSGSSIIFQHSRWSEITRRIFEGMASMRLIITDRLPNHTHINDLFTENEDIVYYDDVNEAISKINYYLYDHKERFRIARNGMIKTMASHTQKQRVDSIIEKYNSYEVR